MSATPNTRYSRRIAGQNPDGGYDAAHASSEPAHPIAGKAAPERLSAAHASSGSEGPRPGAPRQNSTSTAKEGQDVTSLPAVRRSAVSHARKREEDHIPRPPNAFILFRSHFIASRKVSTDVENQNNKLSMIIGHVWKGMSAEEKRPFERLADIEKEKHAQLYPDYKYSPASRKNTPRRGSRTTKAERERCKQIGSFVQHGVHGSALDKIVQESGPCIAFSDDELSPSPSPSIRSSSMPHTPEHSMSPEPGRFERASSDHVPSMYPSNAVPMDGCEPCIPIAPECSTSPWLMPLPFNQMRIAEAAYANPPAPTRSYNLHTFPSAPWEPTDGLSTELVFGGSDGHVSSFAIPPASGRVLPFYGATASTLHPSAADSQMLFQNGMPALNASFNNYEFSDHNAEMLF